MYSNSYNEFPSNNRQKHQRTISANIPTLYRKLPTAITNQINGLLKHQRGHLAIPKAKGLFSSLPRPSSREFIGSQNYPRRNDNKLRFRAVVPKVWSLMSNISTTEKLVRMQFLWHLLDWQLWG